jgi:hypothetical protein
MKQVELIPAEAGGFSAEGRRYLPQKRCCAASLRGAHSNEASPFGSKTASHLPMTGAYRSDGGMKNK